MPDAVDTEAKWAVWTDSDGEYRLVASPFGDLVLQRKCGDEWEDTSLDDLPPDGHRWLSTAARVWCDAENSQRLG